MFQVGYSTTAPIAIGRDNVADDGDSPVIETVELFQRLHPLVIACLSLLDSLEAPLYYSEGARHEQL
jgi:hypothetical protein